MPSLPSMTDEDGSGTTGTEVDTAFITAVADYLLDSNTNIGTNTFTGVNTFSHATPIVLSHASGGITERGRFFQMGEWQSVAHNDANYVGPAGDTADWVVEAADQQTYKYTKVGNIWMAMLTIANSSVANAPSSLEVGLAGGQPPVAFAGGTFWYLDNGTAGIGRWFVVAAGSRIQFQKISGNWTNSTNATTLQATIMFDI